MPLELDNFFVDQEHNQCNFHPDLVDFSIKLVDEIEKSTSIIFDPLRPINEEMDSLIVMTGETGSGVELYFPNDINIAILQTYDEGIVIYITRDFEQLCVILKEYDEGTERVVEKFLKLAK